MRYRHDCSTTPARGVPRRHSVSKIVERHVGVRRALHVDAHEEPVRVGRLEDAAQVVDGRGAVDVEAELRELQRDVALDAGLRRSRR